MHLSKLSSQRPSICHLDVSSYQHDSNADHGQPTTDGLLLQRSGWLKRAKKVGFTTPAGQIEHRDQKDSRQGGSLPYIVREAHDAGGISDDNKVDARRYHNKRIGQTKTDFKNDEDIDPWEQRRIDADTASETDLRRRSENTSISNGERPFRSERRGTRSQRNPTIRNLEIISGTGDIHSPEEGTTPEIIERVSQRNNVIFREDIVDDVSRPSRREFRPYQASVRLPAATPSSPLHALKRSESRELGSQCEVRTVSRLPEIRETPERSSFSDTRDGPRHTTVLNRGVYYKTAQSITILLN